MKSAKHSTAILSILLLMTLLAGCAPLMPSATSNSEPQEHAGTDLLACEEGFRLFDHEFLATEAVCVPEDPTRIAAMDRFTYETLLALGFEPIAGTNFALGIADNLPYLASRINPATSVGDTTAINLERLLTLEPDLIFTLESYEATAELRQIAPTVSLDFESSNQWTHIAAATAEAVNRTAELETIRAAYEQRLVALSETLDVSDDFRVSIVRPGEESISLAVRNLFLHTILSDAGLSVPESWQDLGETAYAEISLERLDLADADVMLIWWYSANPGTNEEAAQYLAELQENTLWQTLNVAQSGNVHLVGSYWIGSSYHAAHAVIDDLFRFVAGVDPSEIAPNPFQTDGNGTDTPGDS